MLKETTLSIFLDPPRFWAVGRSKEVKAPSWALLPGAAVLAGTGRRTHSFGLCCRNHVPQVMVHRRQPASSPSAGYQSLPQGTELGVHQLLQHPFARAPAQERRLCHGPPAMAPSTILLLKIALFLAHC